jgi:hypothetical protein
MADPNPTAGPQVVPIHLPDAQAGILRSDMLGWLAGIEHDLDRFRDGLRDPQATVREAEAFRRLLVALDSHKIELPDDDARTALAGAADGYDQANGYARIAAVHDAHHALLEPIEVGR